MQGVIPVTGSAEVAGELRRRTRDRAGARKIHGSEPGRGAEERGRESGHGAQRQDTREGARTQSRGTRERSGARS